MMEWSDWQILPQKATIKLNKTVKSSNFSPLEFKGMNFVKTMKLRGETVRVYDVLAGSCFHRPLWLCQGSSSLRAAKGRLQNQAALSPLPQRIPWWAMAVVVSVASSQLVTSQGLREFQQVRQPEETWPHVFGIDQRLHALLQRQRGPLYPWLMEPAGMCRWDMGRPNSK